MRAHLGQLWARKGGMGLSGTKDLLLYECQWEGREGAGITGS